jgi:hypothetical protein
MFKDGHYYVIDNDDKIIVPPNKYDYIDIFDECGLARVKCNGYTNIFNPKESTKDRWGIINTCGKEILPAIYDEIWKFYGKNLKHTKVIKEENLIDGDGDPYTIKTIYKFNFFYRKLIEEGYWIDDEYYEAIEDVDNSSQYSIWDAIDDEIEAAGNIDWEG